MTVGENGVLTQAQWANFASEMTAIREKVDLEIASKYINEKKVDIFTEPVKVDDLSGTLKREMLYIMAGMPDEKEPKDYKDNEEDLNFLVDDSGNLKGYHYVRAELSDGESKKYIYDEDRDVIYKVKATNILGTKLHTYEYACKLKGVPFRDISSKLDYLINKGSVMVRTGNISYYAPDLENFRSGVVSLVYHKKNKLDETKEVPYYLSGITDQVTINKGILGTEKTYVWYDYSEDSKMWANIKCEDWNYELTTYWTWIPRYAYKITPREVNGAGEQTKPGEVDIKFVDLDGYYYDYSSGTEKKIKAEEKGYTVAAAFNQSEKPLKGIWIAKYEPSKEPLGFKLSKNKEAVNPPDLDGFDKEKTYYVTYGSNGNSDEQALVVKENGKENPPPENWYDYTAGNENTGDIGKRWATIKCVNTVDNKNLTTYWVWIPRYIYRVEQGEIQIIYVDENNKPLDEKYNVYFEEGIFKMGTADDEFKVLAAFEQGGNHLKGIWMSKYEPSHEKVNGFYLSDMENPKAASNAPDLSNLNPNNTYYVTYGEDGTGEEQAILVQGNNEPENWYDYTKKKWANIKCVNTVNGKELTTYWVWIPRYASRVTQGQVEIIYIDENNKPLDEKYSNYKIGTSDSDDYKVQAAFEQGGQHLKGIWMSKYEPSMISTEFENSTNPAYVNAPDLSNFNPSNTYYVKYGEDGQGAEQATLVQGNSAPSNWYDYPNKRWANIKCVNTVNGKQVTTYWTWIPSYAYRVTQGQVEIIYVKYNNGRWEAIDPQYRTNYTIGTGANDFKVGAAFEQGGEHLNGIWVAKYEPSDATK